jgi:RND family efflux transporter MFP subunit
MRRITLIVIAVVIVAAAALVVTPARHAIMNAMGISSVPGHVRYTCPMHPGVVSDRPGECPRCGMALQIDTTAAAAAKPTVDASGKPAADGDASDIEFWTCTMHPSVHETGPGRCPICNMDLVPVKKSLSKHEAETGLTFSVSKAKQQLVGVTFASAETRDVHKTIHAYGRVDYDETRRAVVNLRVGGWIEKLFVDFTGKLVRQGTPLFTIYSPDLLSAQSEYLLALDGADSTGGAYAGSLAATARARLRHWQITDQQIEELEASRTPQTSVTILSPVSGYVIDKMAVEGMRVEPDMTLYTIADISEVWVQADVYESDLRFVRAGEPATVTLTALPGRTISGSVSYIDPYLNPMTRATRVRVALPNKDGVLKPDMVADVGFHVDLGRRLVVPDTAVLRTGERDVVFVDRGEGTFEVRIVQLGVHAEGAYEIDEGIREGERVVTSANFLIDAESRVQGVFRRMEGDDADAAPPAHRH